MRALAGALLLLNLSWPLSSQSAPLEAIFLPPQFYVGDRVELRLRYRVAAGDEVLSPISLPEHEWIEFRDIEIQDGRAPGNSGEVLVRVFFTPYAAGQTILSPLLLGDLITEELLVTTRSVLELAEDRSLRGPRQQLNVPLTWLRILGVALGVAGTPLLLLFLLRRGMRGLARVREARRRRLPFLHASRSLNQLAAGGLSAEGKSFFVLLSLTVRRYLSERLSRPLMSVTTAEILPELRGAGMERELSERIFRMLKGADLIKFSARGTTKGEMERCLEDAFAIVRQVEERTAGVEA